MRSETPPSMKNCPHLLYSQSDHFPAENGLLLISLMNSHSAHSRLERERHDFTRLTPQARVPNHRACVGFVLSLKAAEDW
jgi:hypothetical protein